MLLAHVLKLRLMVGQSKVNNFNIFNAFLISECIKRGRRGHSLFFEHNHNIFWFQIPMNNFQPMQINGSLYNFPNNKCTNILRQSLPLPDILIKILPIYILSNNIDMRFTSNSIFIFYNLRMRYYLHYFTLVIKSSNSLGCQLLCWYIF